MVPAFGRLLSAALAAHGMSQNAFAKAMGMSQGSLSRMLRGERKPPVDAVVSWARFLDLSPREEHALICAALVAGGMPKMAARLDELATKNLR